MAFLVVLEIWNGLKMLDSVQAKLGRDANLVFLLVRRRRWEIDHRVILPLAHISRIHCLKIIETLGGYVSEAQYLQVCDATADFQWSIAFRL
jgi:hypothetical protein